MVDLQPGDLVVVIKRRVIPMGTKLPYDDQRLIVKALVLGGQGGPPSIGHTAYAGKSIIYHRYILKDRGHSSLMVDGPCTTGSADPHRWHR